MARLFVFALALFAVLAAVTAGGQPPQGGKAHPIRDWVHNEGAKIQTAWKTKVAPQIAAMEKKLGAEWQKKEPVVAAELKKQAGKYFNQALNWAQQKLSSGR